MTSTLRKSAAALLATMAFALPAAATSFSTDYTDLWFNPAESGWGVNVIQQADTMFATLFVYGTDNTARWYVASSTVGSSQTTFSGPLYQTTGPYFGVPFNPTSVVVTQVGSMSFNFNSPTSGTLQYTVNGTTVTKSIQRQLFKNNTLAGNYLGGLTAACNSGGSAILTFDRLTVTHSASQQVSATVTFFNGSGVASSCTYAGSYSQAGKMGTIAGNWNCTVGSSAANAGSFTINQIEVSPTGFSGKFSGSDQFCSSYNGNFGGVRDVQ